MGEGGSAKRWLYFISLFSDKGEGGVKNLKKWVTSYTEGPTYRVFITFIFVGFLPNFGGVILWFDLDWQYFFAYFSIYYILVGRQRVPINNIYILNRYINLLRIMYSSNICVYVILSNIILWIRVTFIDIQLHSYFTIIL